MVSSSGCSISPKYHRTFHPELSRSVGEEATSTGKEAAQVWYEAWDRSGSNACMLVLKGAHDKIQRPRLWQAVQRLGLHGRMLTAFTSLYSCCRTSQVTIEGRVGQRYDS